ncbi:IL-6 subfamily cytokine M17, partial [Stigmatopora nigra]
ARQSVRSVVKMTRLALKESTELLKIYNASQGAWSDDYCHVSRPDVPKPNISGLDQVLDRVLVFWPHLRLVYEQQKELQDPGSPLVLGLKTAWSRNQDLGARLMALGVFPEVVPSVPSPPLVQNVFEQKVYGCVLLKNYKKFLIRALRELRTLKGRACKKGWRKFCSV